MFLFALLESIMSHVGSFLRKQRSNAKDLAYLKRIHRGFVRRGLEANMIDSGVQYRGPSQAPEPRKANKWLKQIIVAEDGKKKQQWQERSHVIRKRIRARKGGARARWVGGR